MNVVKNKLQTVGLAFESPGEISNEFKLIATKIGYNGWTEVQEWVIEPRVGKSSARYERFYLSGIVKDIISWSTGANKSVTLQFVTMERDEIIRCLGFADNAIEISRRLMGLESLLCGKSGCSLDESLALLESRTYQSTRDKCYFVVLQYLALREFVPKGSVNGHFEQVCNLLFDVATGKCLPSSVDPFTSACTALGFGNSINAVIDPFCDPPAPKTIDTGFGPDERDDDPK